MKKTTIAIILITASLIFTSSAVPFSNRINLHGGKTSTKSMAVWELYKFRDTELLRKYPLCWCPWTAYSLVINNVTVEDRNNKNWLCINTDLYNATINEAKYNKDHAKKFKGTTRQKVRKIYNYCRRTEYVIHVKRARDVFEKRQGDCAAISAAFYVLCKKNKIPVRYCIGWCDEGCHAWNRVKIGKTWYYVDATMGRYLWKPLYDGYTLMEMW